MSTNRFVGVESSARQVHGADVYSPPGSRTVNTDPLPASLATVTSPPIMRASLRESRFELRPGSSLAKNKDSGGKRPRDAEAEIAVPKVMGVPDAASSAEVLRRVVPGTAATDMLTTVTTCHPCRAILGCPIVIAMSAILDPFPNIAVHVMQAECVGGE